MSQTIPSYSMTWQARNDQNPVRRNLCRRLFRSALGKGRRARWLARLRGKEKETYLPCLGEVLLNRIIIGQHYNGIETVALAKIIGSEGRKGDFDRAFRPLKEESLTRWQSIALALLEDKVLPPLELIRIGDEYFVRDGHHRISVARSLGQSSIEAQISVLILDDY
jgi:hypothetical protein